MDRKKIVVWDPHRSLAEGTVVPDGDNNRRAELTRGLVTLPYDPALHDLGSVGGYARKGFGSGMLFTLSAPARGCPLLVATPQDGTRLYWVARLCMAGGNLSGNIRLTSYPNNLSSVACSAVPLEGPLELAELGPCDRHGGWTVRGTAALSCPTAGYVSIGLQGIAQHLGVLWFAASVTRGS